MIDRNGSIVVAPRYRSVSHYCGGLACVATGEQYGYIDNEGHQVIPPFFDDARAFSEGLAAVKLNGRWGYIDRSGTSAIPVHFNCEGLMAGPFRDGLARVAETVSWDISIGLENCDSATIR